MTDRNNLDIASGSSAPKTKQQAAKQSNDNKPSENSGVKKITKQTTTVTQKTIIQQTQFKNGNDNQKLNKNQRRRLKNKQNKNKFNKNNDDQINETESSQNLSTTTVVDQKSSSSQFEHEVLDHQTTSVKMGGGSSKSGEKTPEIIIESTTISNEHTEQQHQKCVENIKINTIETQPKHTEKLSVSDSQTIVEISSEPIDFGDSDSCLEKYRVDSPPPLTVQKNKSLGQVKKSKSLDDDTENIQITEIVESEGLSQSASATSFTSDVNTAIVSESEDEVQWETASELRIPENTSSQVGSFSAIAKCLDEDTAAPVSTINDAASQRTYFTQDEMNNFREFLQELDLQNQYGYNNLPSNFGQLCLKTVDSKAILSPENILERRARKRALLESYFIPTFQNPRQLDIIHEEGSSDLSDKEMTSHPQPAPNPPRSILSSTNDIPWIDDMGDDDVFEEISEKKPKLVEAKVIDVSETVAQEQQSTTEWKTERVQSPHDENIEVVYIDEDEGSESSRSDRLSATSFGDLEDTQEADDEYSKEDTLLNQAVDEIQTRKIVETQSSLENIMDLPLEIQDDQKQLEVETVRIENRKETKEEKLIDERKVENVEEIKEATKISEQNTKEEKNIEHLIEVKMENLQNQKISAESTQIDQNTQKTKPIVEKSNQDKEMRTQVETIIPIQLETRKSNPEEKIIPINLKEATKNIERNIEIQTETTKSSEAKENSKERIVEIKLKEAKSNPKSKMQKEIKTNSDERVIEIKLEESKRNPKLEQQSTTKTSSEERVIEIKLEGPKKNPKEIDKKCKKLSEEHTKSVERNVEIQTETVKSNEIRENFKECIVEIKLEEAKKNPKLGQQLPTETKSEERIVEVKLEEPRKNPKVIDTKFEKLSENKSKTEERIVEIKSEEKKSEQLEKIQSNIQERVVEIKLEEPKNNIRSEKPTETKPNIEERIVEIKLEDKRFKKLDKTTPNLKEHVEIKLEEPSYNLKSEKQTETKANTTERVVEIKLEETKPNTAERIVEIKLEDAKSNPKDTKSEEKNVEIKIETAKNLDQSQFTSIKNIEEKLSVSEKRNEEVNFKCIKRSMGQKEVEKPMEIKPENNKARVIKIEIEKNNNQQKTDTTKKSATEHVIPIKLENSSKEIKSPSVTSPSQSSKTERTIPIKLETSTKSDQQSVPTSFANGFDKKYSTTFDQSSKKEILKTQRSISIEEKSIGSSEVHQTKHSRFLTNPIKNFDDLKLCSTKQSPTEEKNIYTKNPELVTSNLILHGSEYFSESDIQTIRANSEIFVEKLLDLLPKIKSENEIKKVCDFLEKISIEDQRPQIQKKIQEVLISKNDDLEIEKLQLSQDGNNNEHTAFDKEFESLFKTVNELNEDRISATPSRPESSNSFGSSSTTNTVRHIPTSSSLTDIHSEAFEQEFLHSVKSLREIAFEKIKTLPYGLDILEELAKVSEIIQTMTKTLESTTNQHLHHNLINKKHHPKKSAILIDDSPPPVPALPKNISTVCKYKNWVGLPTETDPRLLVCLSPAQRSYEDQQKSSSHYFKYINPDRLLDMHTKFMERRGYHESILPNAEVSSGHRLLKIIHENQQPQTDTEEQANVPENTPRTPQKGTTAGYVSDDEELSKYFGQTFERTYHSDTEIKSENTFVPINLSNQPFHSTNETDYSRQYQRSQSATLPQTKSSFQSEIVEEKIFPFGTRKEPIFIPNLETYLRKHGVRRSPKPPLIDDKTDEPPKIKIQTLSEWMTQARRRTQSTTDSQTFNRQLSENLHESKTSTTDRRFSLPQEIHEKQLKYILEKEREIEREIAELEAEKKRLASTLQEEAKTPTTTQVPETSSGHQEIRWLRRPNEIPASCMIYGDFFRKQMFEEYMSKIAEREQRKQQKVIKISTTSSDSGATEGARRNSDTTTTDPINFKNLVDIENEFMNKVKERKAKLGIKESSEDEGDDKTTKTQNIPKHLQEFVQFATSESKSESTTTTSEFHRKIEETTVSKDHCSRTTSRLRNNRYNSEVAYTKLGKQILKPMKKSFSETSSLLHEIDSSLNLARGFLLGRGVWSPGQKQSTVEKSSFSETKIEKSSHPNSLPLSQTTSSASTTTTTSSPTIKPINEVIWTPKSASPSPSVERKEFRPVNFQSPTLERKHKTDKVSEDKKSEPKTPPIPPPWQNGEERSSHQQTTSTSSSSKTSESRLTTSHSAPITGLNSLQTASSSAISLASHTTISTSTARLPRAQNPTITLLQKAREGQLPRGASYIDESKRTPPRRSSDDRPPLIGPNETLKNEYVNEKKFESPRKMVDLAPRKFEGIGPTTKEGVPIVLRSEVKENNQAKWYKRMYETLHKTKDDDYVTIRYKQRKGRYPYTASSGYLSEPEPNADIFMYDSDATVSPRSATFDRRYSQQLSRDKENYVSSTMPRNTRSMSASTTIKHGSETYRNQPGRIEDYVPGHSSISEKEAKEWWDEVMEIFNGHLEQQKLVPQHSKSYMAQALKESGYESDSTLIFKRRDDTTQQLSPQEQKEAYKAIQRGGEVPLHGLRKPAPERPKEEAGIEYFPISPTLTRIRVHRNKTLANQYYCYPITSITHTATTKSRSKSPPLAKPNPTKSSSGHPKATTTSRHAAPSPPRRKSSRYNSTLKLVSNISVSSTMLKKPVDSNEIKSGTSNVQYLKDRINYKINLPSSAQSTSKTTSATSTTSSKPRQIKLTRSIYTSPSDRTKVTSTITSRLRSKTDTTRASTPDISSRLRPQSRSPSGIRSRHTSEPCSLSVSKNATNVSSTKSRPVSLERTFGVAKRKAELSTLATKSDGMDSRLRKSTDLISPTEVKKVLHQHKVGSKDIPSGTIVKKSAVLYSSIKNNLGLRGRDKILNTTAYITPQGREILKESQKLSSTSTKTSEDPKIRDTSTKKQSKKATILKPVQKSGTNKSESKTQSRTNNGSKNKSKTKKTKKVEENGKKKDSKLINIQEKENVEKRIDKAVSTERKSEKPETFSGYGRVTINDINRQKQIIQSDTFFQKLLLRDLPSPTSSITSYRSSNVLEKARMFQTYEFRARNYEPTKIPTVYLSHRKPVTESKFRNFDLQRYSLPIIGNNPYHGYGVSEKIRHFDSMSQIDDDSMTIISSLRGKSPESYGRSSSEPPMKVAEFRPTKEIRSPRTLTPSPSPSPVRSPARRKILSIKSPKHFSEPPPPVKTIRTRSAGDAEAVKREIRRSLKKQDPISVSTSSLTLSNISDHSEYQTYIAELIHSHRRSEKFKDLQNFYIALERKGQLEKTTSSSELRPSRRREEIIDFDLWKKVRSYEKAEQELKNLYRQLKMDEKEKGFLFQPSDANMIRWKREKDRALRLRDKSIKDLKEHFAKLKNELTALHLAKQRELEITKDTYKPLWRGNSVTNLAQHMVERRTKSESRASQQNIIPNKTFRDLAGIGSRIWSSLSMDQVNAIKNQLSEIYNLTSSSRKIKSPIQENECVIEIPPNDKKLKDQVNSKLHVRSSSLSAAEKKERSPSQPSKKSDSIGAIRLSPTSSTTSQKKTLSESEKKRLSSTLSKEALDRLNKRHESKNRESLILAKETRGAIAASKANLSPSRQKSTEVSSTEPRTCYSLETSLESDSLNKELTSDKSNFVLVLTPSNDTEEKTKVKDVLNEWAQKPPEKTPSKRMSASETESASSDASTKTVICKMDKNKDELQKKINFFEKKTDEKSVETVPQKFQDQSSQTNHIPDENKSATLKKSKKLVPSQSFADLKELFGEQERVKYSSSPLPKDTRFSSPTNSSQVYTASNSPVRFISDGSSQESIYRSRSLSPDPERYWRAYLALVKNGDVLKLKNKFESMEDFKKQNVHQQPKRYRSDPELTRIFLSKKDTDLDKIIIRGQEYGDVEWLRRRYETKQSSSRGRTRIRNRGRNISPIPKHPLRIEDRYMPHINVISKLASLKSKTLSKQKSSSDKDLSSVVPPGEVKKLKTKFDSPTQNDMSLIGQMFTSSPNINELRDISPYLAGPWIAHKFPKRQDNSRSLSSPDSLLTENNGTYPPRRQTHVKSRPKSVSPPRSKKPLSILKTPSSGTITTATTTSTTKTSTHTCDMFANQKFNPAIHRPICRYQPPPTTTDHSLQDSSSRSWWTAEPSVKPTVKFKEPEFAPIPPPKGQHHSKDYGPESPRRYVENEVTIHYRSPVRQEIKEVIAEEELARRQAEAMRRIYQEERRRKYLQELHDMNSRRHTDNFTPSQKSPIPLNRYDDFDEVAVKQSKSRDRTPEPRLVARALFNFVGQTPRELTFKKGDIIYVRRQIDKNWYEGEHNAMIGLFPFNYVEIIPYDNVKTMVKKPHEGQARAKFNFIAQTHLELSLAKGELVILTRRVDENWFEGRIGNKKGIFPVSYVEILSYPGETPTDLSKPVAAPAAHSLLLNGSSGGKQSMGSHHYQPQLPSQTSPMSSSYHHAKPVTISPYSTGAGPQQYGSLSRQQPSAQTASSKSVSINQTLHIDTHSEPIPYRALYKYRPQNEDELELLEGDIVYVLEKCDDGWYVGSSQRTGAFGTFPGNYVERIK